MEVVPVCWWAAKHALWLVLTMAVSLKKSADTALVVAEEEAETHLVVVLHQRGAIQH